MQRKSLFCANTDVFINIWSRTANILKLTLDTVDSSGSKIRLIKCKKCWLYMITAASTVFQKLWPLWMQCAVECLVVAQQFVLLYYRAREGKQPHRPLSLTVQVNLEKRFVLNIPQYVWKAWFILENWFIRTVYVKEQTCKRVLEIQGFEFSMLIQN